MHWRRKRGGGRGACAPPHTHTHFREWGGGKDMFVPPPTLSDPEFRHRAYWYLWRHFGVACITVLGPSDVPPTPHFVTFLRRCYVMSGQNNCSFFFCIGDVTTQRRRGRIWQNRWYAVCLILDLLVVVSSSQSQVLRFPPPVKLSFHHYHDKLCVDMTLVVAEALSPNTPN